MASVPSIPGLVLRAAKPADVPYVVSQIKDLCRFLGHESATTEVALFDALFGPQPYTEVIVADLNGEITGFAQFSYCFSSCTGLRCMSLGDLYVREEHRKKGIGKIFLSYLAHIAVSRHCGRFEWSVLNSNLPSIKFYKDQARTLPPCLAICCCCCDVGIHGYLQ